MSVRPNPPTLVHRLTTMRVRLASGTQPRMRLSRLVSRSVLGLPAIASLIGSCSSSGPLGDCPGRTTRAQCVSRVDAWKVAFESRDGGTDSGTDGGSDGGADGGTPYPSNCPTIQELGPGAVGKLDLPGYAIVDGPTQNLDNDTCCYVTNDVSC